MRIETGKTTGRNEAVPGGEAQLSLRILTPAARYIAEKFGGDALEEIKCDAGLESFVLENCDDWGTLAQVEAFWAGVRARMETDEEFMTAAVYKPEESYGPLAFLLVPDSPVEQWRRAVKTTGSLSAISRYELRDASDNHAVIRYESDKAESRLMCLSRKAQGSAFHSLWGLKSARCTERACVSRGDPACIYEVHWNYRRPIAIPTPLLCILLGGGFAGAVAAIVFGSAMTVLLAAGIGGSLGSALASWRMNKKNLAATAMFENALRVFARDEAATRREIRALNDKEQKWTRVMEQKVAERTEALEAITAQIRSFQNARKTSLREFSHDMRGSLMTLKMSLHYLDDLQPSEKDTTEVYQAVVDSMYEDIRRLDKALGDLVEQASADARIF